VTARSIAARISRRAQRAGVTVPPDAMPGLEGYLEHLTRWNRKITLTALPLEPLSDDAVDRLIVEPVAAAASVEASDRVAIDIGSGGGSPAVPLRLACPHLRMVMVESKVRKTAFLREIIRQLDLENTSVENSRVEELLLRPDLHEFADIVTIRAVRAEPKLWSAIQAFLRPGGRVFWFGSGREPSKQQSLIIPFTLKSELMLCSSTGSRLTILQKI
jgi:16S rRNA (guanine527-N7)-methyltransferase